MFRAVLCVTGALLTFGMATIPAAADDSETCYDYRNEAAIAACSRLIDQNPGDAVRYNNRGNAYLNKRDYDRAMSDFNQAIRLDSKLATAFNGRGFAYNDGKHDYDRAISDFDQAIQLNPKYAAAHGGRGHAYEKKGDYVRALADFEQALRLEPAFAFAREGRDRVRVALAAPTTPVPQATPVPQERRVALVIGNSRYASAPHLPNPARDAEAVAAALRQTGFQTVTAKSDLGRDAMRDALRAFRDAADAADWALIYYAGHGIQIGGVNYLVPVDAALSDERDVDGATVAYGELEKTVRGAKALQIVILDACRDDPFAAQIARLNPTHAMTRGLIPPPEPRPGLLVVYSAKAGQLAEDGVSGNHSPFAAALIAHLGDSGRDVRRVFDYVSADVMDATNSRQQPFTYGSLPVRREFYFAAGR
jgi:tetratricopeptide (TPR) repeat protein